MPRIIWTARASEGCRRPRRCPPRWSPTRTWCCRSRTRASASVLACPILEMAGVRAHWRPNPTLGGTRPCDRRRSHRRRAGGLRRAVPEPGLHGRRAFPSLINTIGERCRRTAAPCLRRRRPLHPGGQGHGSRSLDRRLRRRDAALNNQSLREASPRSLLRPHVVTGSLEERPALVRAEAA